MARNKPIIAHGEHELRCCALACNLEEIIKKAPVPCDAKDFEKAAKEFNASITPEEKKKLTEPNEIAGKYEGFIGATVDFPNIFLLFDAEKEEKAIDCWKELTEKGFDFQPVKNAVYVDKRYLDGGKYSKLHVKLPVPYIEKAIIDLLEKYCFEVEIGEKVDADLVIYVGDLGGGRNVQIMVGGGDKFLSAGMDNAEHAFVTSQPTNFYKHILADLERQIVQWREDHSGCCKEIRA